MTRALQIVKLALLLSAVGLLCLLGFLTWTATRILRDLSREIQQTVAQVQPAIQNLNQATAQWSQASKAQADSVTAIERDVRVEMWQLDRTLQTAQGTLATASTTIAAIEGDADAAKPVLAASRSALDSLSTTTASLNARINDPAIPQTLKHVQSMTASGDKMLADAQEKEHQLLHPDKKRLGFWGVLGAGVMWIHRLMPPIF